MSEQQQGRDGAANMELFAACAAATRNHDAQHLCGSELDCFETGYLQGARWQAARAATPPAAGGGDALLNELERLACEQLADLHMRGMSGVCLMLPPEVARALLARRTPDAGAGR